MQETEIIVSTGDTTLPAVINNSTPSKKLLTLMPITIQLQKYAHDFCGVMQALPYKPEELRNGWSNGDLAFAADGNYFAILYKDEEISEQYSNMVTLGKISVTPEIMDTLPDSISITLSVKQ